MKDKAIHLLARAVEANLQPIILETTRTEEEHQVNVAAGRSWVKHSKHIDGLAIDIGLRDLLQYPNWAPDDPKWQRLGQIGENLGLTWGGRWKVRDMVHFEWRIQ